MFLVNGGSLPIPGTDEFYRFVDGLVLDGGVILIVMYFFTIHHIGSILEARRDNDHINTKPKEPWAFVVMWRAFRDKVCFKVYFE